MSVLLPTGATSCVVAAAGCVVPALLCKGRVLCSQITGFQAWSRGRPFLFYLRKSLALCSRSGPSLALLTVTSDWQDSHPPYGVSSRAFVGTRLLGTELDLYVFPPSSGEWLVLCALPNPASVRVIWPYRTPAPGACGLNLLLRAPCSAADRCHLVRGGRRRWRKTCPSRAKLRALHVRRSLAAHQQHVFFKQP